MVEVAAVTGAAVGRAAVPLDCRVPGHALAIVLELLPQPRQASGWDTTDDTCERLLDWLRGEAP